MILDEVYLSVADELDFEQIYLQLSLNIAHVVARQEQTRIRAIELHGLIDDEIDKAVVLINTARQFAHEAIEDRSKDEMDALHRHLNLLEQSLDFFHEQNELAHVNLSEYSTTTIDKIAATELHTQSLKLIKSHVDTVRALPKIISAGSVILKKTRCDKLQALLSKGELFTVCNDSELRCSIPRKDDAMVILTSIFERHNICEDCFVKRRTERETVLYCSSCGATSTRDRDNLQHTINRKAGIIGGRGNLAAGGHALKYPQGVALVTTESDKLLFVSDSSTHRIEVFESATGHFLRTLASRFNSPYFMTTLVRNNTQLLFVSDYHNNRVQIIDVSLGDVVKGSIVVNCPLGLAVMESQVNDSPMWCLYVSSSFGSQVLVHNVDTLLQVNRIETGPQSNGLALLPSSLSDLPESRLFVCDMANHSVQVLDAMSGRFMSTYGAELLQSPFGATVSSSLDSMTHMLVISDNDLHRLFLFDAITGDSKKSIGSMGSAIGQFRNANDVIAIRDDNDHIIIYTADSNNNRVQITVV